MQRRHEDGRRPRISVSLEPEDYEWIQSFKGPSDSYTVSKLIQAARLQGVTLAETKTGGVLEEFSEWLAQKRKNKLAADMHELIDEFLQRK